MKFLFQTVVCALFFVPVFAAEPQTSTEQIEAHARAAQQALRANQPAKAIPEYEAIVRLEPKNLDAKVNLGALLFFSGDYARAVPVLRKAVEQKPDLWKTVALLGMGEKRMGDRGAATDLRNAFTHLTDDKIRVQVGMELIELDYASGDLNQAADIAAVLRRLRPTDPDVLYTAHRIYSDLADETTLAMVMAAPDSARMHQIMGQELARHGQTESAITQYREALKIAPRTPGLHFELAELLAQSESKEDQAQVEHEYEAALAANPLDVKAECRLGEIAFKTSNLKAAYDHFTRAASLEPDDADANLGLGKTLLSMHETAKATPLLEHAVKDDPTSAVAHYRLAMAYRSSGRSDDAARELAEFQKLKTTKEKLGNIYKGMMVKPKGGEAGGTAGDAPM
jgi:cytochrome c-type biogenesis protein CcmH/NrfG